MVAVTDGAGSLLGLNSYDPYGKPAPYNLGRFGYTGQAWLPELGMWYYKARIYNPANTVARFMQTDPIGYGDGVNMYAYVGGDPMNRADPSGNGCVGYGCGDNQTVSAPSYSSRLDAFASGAFSTSLLGPWGGQADSRDYEIARREEDLREYGLFGASGETSGSDYVRGDAQPTQPFANPLGSLDVVDIAGRSEPLHNGVAVATGIGALTGIVIQIYRETTDGRRGVDGTNVFVAGLGGTATGLTASVPGVGAIIAPFVAEHFNNVITYRNMVRDQEKNRR